MLSFLETDPEEFKTLYERRLSVNGTPATNRSSVRKSAATAAPAPIPKVGTLRVHVRHAKGLKAADMFGGDSDPFVECTVGKDKKQNKKTKTVDNNNSPAWDETLEFEGEFDDLTAVPLLLRVMDADMFSSESLGEVPPAALDLCLWRLWAPVARPLCAPLPCVSLLRGHRVRSSRSTSAC